MRCPERHGKYDMPDNVFIAYYQFTKRRGFDTLTLIMQAELRSTWLEGFHPRLCNTAWPCLSSAEVQTWRMAVYAPSAQRQLPLSRANDAAWHLTPDEFNWLIAGADWHQVKGHDLAKWVWQNGSELRPRNTQNTLLPQ